MLIANPIDISSVRKNDQFNFCHNSKTKAQKCVEENRVKFEVKMDILKHKICTRKLVYWLQVGGLKSTFLTLDIYVRRKLEIY